MRKILMMMSVCVAGLAGKAQQTVVPGDKNIRYDLIKAGAEKCRFMTIDSTGKVLTESTVINMYSVDSASNRFIKTQFRMVGKQGTLVDSTVAELSTLKPIRMSMNTTPFLMTMHLDFNDKDVHAKAKRGKANTDTVHKMSSPYFDSNLFDYFVGLLKYQPGASYQFNMYTFELNGDDPFTLTCVGEETIADGKNNQVPVYHIEASSKSMRGMKVQYWIEKSTGSVVKNTFKIGGGRTFIILRD